MHGFEQFFIGIANSITSMWGGRSLLFRPTFFDDPRAQRRSQIISTMLCVIATLILLALAASAVGLLWWAFTRHERM